MTYELQPFNQARFDACMAWVAKQFDRTLSQYEAVKIHALADALHVVRFYTPIIGGTLRKLQNGPVALNALNRAKSWGADDEAPFKLTDTRGKTLFFTPKSLPTRESMFTKYEREAILESASKVFSMTFAQSQNFFHGETDEQNSFLGKAWRKTSVDKAPISWNMVLKFYADETGQNLDELKALVCA